MEGRGSGSADSYAHGRGREDREVRTDRPERGGQSYKIMAGVLGLIVLTH
jgi:hypothetical protein